MTILKVPKFLRTSERGTSMKLPIIAPNRVPPPPITTDAIGIIEKSSANMESPDHMYICDM